MEFETDVLSVPSTQERPECRSVVHIRSCVSQYPRFNTRFSLRSTVLCRLRLDFNPQNHSFDIKCSFSLKSIEINLGLHLDLGLCCAWKEKSKCTAVAASAVTPAYERGSVLIRRIGGVTFNAT